ncbi:SAM-dependent methyltransferase [Garicola koreensis]|uniref:Class I SAM-dependent methyltransferase n=1 Tax=Garicola koreensis TaxID=1262554 RepID=A0A7W5TPY2_9MICC|nr:SAM-dependent methyltransferase [Garicola koreensis]MBB3667560.1 hypothetical protein [Garicola koreensis]
MEADRDPASQSTAVVSRPVAADWLGFRREADHRARQSSAHLVDRVSSWLRAGLGPHDAAVVIDLGAGTGSNQAWLAPRLQVPQRWILLDHDADLLESSTATDAEQVAATTRMVGSVDQLPQLMPAQAPALVTCAALLDLLSARQTALIAETISASGAAAVLSLTVTGEVSLTPADPVDQRIAAAFDAHQRRGDLLGPDAAETLAAQLRDLGAHVELTQTDWLLDASRAEFVERYLRDRAQAAAEFDPALAEAAAQWVQRRVQQLRRGELSVRVGHHDVVSVPDAPASASAG